MNERDALAIVGVFSAAYPRQPFSAETGRIWLRALSSVSAEHSLEAADLWVATNEWPPTVAQFLETRRSLVGRPQDLPAIAEWSTSPEPDYPDLLEHLADNRAVLAGAVERIATANRMSPEDVIAAAELARMEAIERRGGALVPCPYCRDGKRDCTAEREADLVRLRAIRDSARLARRDRADEAELAGTAGPATPKGAGK